MEFGFEPASNQLRTR